MKKILIVIPQLYKLGGAEKLGLELAENINKCNAIADILLLFNDISNIDQKNIPSTIIRKVHKLNMDVNPSFFDVIKSIKKTCKIILDNKYEIIETSEITSSIIISIALKFINRPIHHIFGVHQYYDRSIGNKFKYTIWRIILKFNKRIYYYGVSDFVTNQWKKYLNISEKNIRTIHNSINDIYFDKIFDKKFIRLQLGIPYNAIILIFVGRLIAFKGFHNILYALSKDLKINNIHIIYLGSVDPENLRGIDEINTLEILKKLDLFIKTNKLEDNVHFLGHRNDVANIMSAADILVHPTKQESFGLVLVEALALGLMIVSSKIEGVSETLSFTDSILIDPDNLVELRSAVFKFLNMSDIEKTIIKEKGYLRANKFRGSFRTRDMLNLYSELI
jgi:glycosyltransferase involved in cell wall biosynthesis